jgi:hypothetical protein
MYLDLHTRGPFTETSESMLEQRDWPRSSWAGAVSTPGSSQKSQKSLSLSGPAAGASLKSGKEAVKAGGVAFGMPGYGGMGAWGGWEDWDDMDSVVDPIATVDNVRTKALSAHPSQPIFLVGSNNTHVYLWEVCIPQTSPDVIRAVSYISHSSAVFGWILHLLQSKHDIQNLAYQTQSRLSWSNLTHYMGLECDLFKLIFSWQGHIC